LASNVGFRFLDRCVSKQQHFISKIRPIRTFDPIVNIGEEMDEWLSKNGDKSSALNADFLAFRHVDLSQNQNALTATGVENRRQIPHFLTACKI